MKKNFKEQFEKLKAIIETNIETIRSLIEQSEELSKVIQGLKPEDVDLKKSLETIKLNVSDSIKTLAKETTNLFETYDKLIDEVFDK